MLRRLCARRYNRANLIKITQTPLFIFRYVEFPARIMRHRTPRLKVLKVIKDFNDLKVVKVFNSAPRRKKAGAPATARPFLSRNNRLSGVAPRLSDYDRRSERHEIFRHYRCRERYARRRLAVYGIVGDEIFVVVIPRLAVCEFVEIGRASCRERV